MRLPSFDIRHLRVVSQLQRLEDGLKTAPRTLRLAVSSERGDVLFELPIECISGTGDTVLMSVVLVVVVFWILRPSRPEA